MIMQLTVFLENSEGRLAALCRTLADAGVNMDALTIAETSDYGVARIICDNVFHAVDVLKIKPEDRDRAEAAIESAGFKTLHYDDIAS